MSSTYVNGPALPADGSALPADPFATVTGLQQAGYVPTVETPVFGQVRGNGRYHMPLLPGEDGPKSGGEYVPHGCMRVTNLAAAISDSEALNVWEQEQALIGVAKDPSLYEELCLAVHRAEREGCNLQRLDLHPELRRALTGTWKDRDNSLAGRAKAVAGANRARQAGTNRHEAWEYRAQTGELIGPPDIRAQLEALEALLAAVHLERVPGLSERVVRNLEVGCAGRFDDVLRDVRTGELFMADLKNKSRRFWTWLEVDIQLAVYANARWMLNPTLELRSSIDTEKNEITNEWVSDGPPYVDGPALHVNREVGVVLVMPSDGAEPYLRKADLVRGWRNALLARQIVEERSYGKGRERDRWGVWE